MDRRGDLRRMPVRPCPERRPDWGPFAALRVAGTLDFSLTGILSGLTGALATGGGHEVFI
jgi:hypothetical protein